MLEHVPGNDAVKATERGADLGGGEKLLRIPLQNIVQSVLGLAAVFLDVFDPTTSAADAP